MNKNCLFIVVVAWFVGTCVGAKADVTTMPNRLEPSRALNHLLHRRGVESIEEMSLATEDELTQLTAERPALGEEILNLIAGRWLTTGASPFNELNLRDRIRLHRLYVRGLVDFFANEDFLTRYLDLPRGSGYPREDWLRRRDLEVARDERRDGLVIWRTTPITSVGNIKNSRLFNRLDIKTVGEALLASEAELNALPQSAHYNLNGFFTFLAKNGLALNQSPFPNLPLAERIRRYRFGILTEADLQRRWSRIDQLVNANGPPEEYRGHRVMPIVPPSAQIDWPNLAILKAPLSNRLANTLWKNGIKTVGEALMLSGGEFLAIPGLSWGSNQEIQRFAKRRGLKRTYFDFRMLSREERLELSRAGVRTLDDVFADPIRLGLLKDRFEFVSTYLERWTVRHQRLRRKSARARRDVCGARLINGGSASRHAGGV